MKKLIFIDNDNQKNSDLYDDFGRVEDFLNNNGILPMFNNEIEEKYDMQTILNEDKDAAMQLLFDPNTIICTCSVYSAGYPHSLFQLLNYLQAAGRNEVKNKVYIDCSGMILEALNRNIRDAKLPLPILQAIETNYILTNVKNKIERVRVDLKGYFKDTFKTEEIDVPLFFKDL